MENQSQPLVYLSQLAEPAFREAILLRLARMGLPPEALALTPPTDRTYPAVAAHPDLYHCRLGDEILSGEPAGRNYPHNIGFNGVQLGPYFVHNLKYTAAPVLAEVRRLGLTPVNVRQGYTKCNLLVVEDRPPRPAVITSDRGLEKALSPLSVDVLLISPGHVRLPGFPYGFLGGAGGGIGEDILFHGDLPAHPDAPEIASFIRERGKNPVWFSSFPLTDIGSIITLV